ncbi:MAG TPA: hypothetical protein VEB41_16000 [Burkholderiales bacterium]|nr:hypothetical protein [Burkholderiales bacterium]
MLLTKGWQKALVAAVLLAAAAVLAHLHVAAQVYHPVVRLASPDGVTLTALQDETPERQKCGRANDTFLKPMREHCKDCRVLYARCARELDATETALLSNRPLPFYIVHSPGLRLAIEGPVATAKQNCEFIAKDLFDRGYPQAVCLAPRLSPQK